MGKNEERVLRWLKQGCTVKEELESVDAMMKMATPIPLTARP